MTKQKRQTPDSFRITPHRKKLSEEGVVLLLAAITLLAVVICIAFTVSVSEWTATQTELRLATDAAASDASATLCSTRKCWNLSIINALSSVQRTMLPGTTSRAALFQGLQEVIDSLESQISSGVKFISGDDGKNEWTVDGVTIRIQRGRWWPRGVYKTDSQGSQIQIIPSSVDLTRLLPKTSPLSFSSSVKVEPKFEPFDRFDGSSWQSEEGNRGTPAYIAANAVRVEIALDRYRPTLSLGFIASGKLYAETITARNKAKTQLEFCAAPLAIPVCSLLDSSGEYEPEVACQYDRFFTDEKRYCTDQQLLDGTCNVIPGFYYAPLTKGVSCTNSDDLDSKQRCACATEVDQCTHDPIHNKPCPPFWVRGDYDPHASRTGMREVAPCLQELGQGSVECSFNHSWPKLTQVSDHYGVVGMSTEKHTWLDPQSTSAYSWAFNALCMESHPAPDGSTSYLREPSALAMTVGDKFHIKLGGLTDSSLAQKVWDAIWGRPGTVSTDEMKRTHPQFFDPENLLFGPNGFRELGYPWYISRADDQLGFPVGRTKTILDVLISNDWIKPYKNYGEVDSLNNPLPAVAPWECVENQIPQYGVCNSNRVWYGNTCQRRHHWVNESTSNVKFEATDYIQESEGAYTDWQYSDTAAPWSCAEVPPYMPCAGQTAGGQPLKLDSILTMSAKFFERMDDYHPALMRVRHAKIAIIADHSPEAKYCSGIEGTADADPIIDTTHDWRIIGFIRAFLFDSDIGTDPPQPPGSSYWDSTNEGASCDYSQYYGPASTVPSSGIPNRYPWGFNPTYEPPLPGDTSRTPVNWGSTEQCNLIRARVTCNPGLVAGDYHGWYSQKKETAAIVYSR